MVDMDLDGVYAALDRAREVLGARFDEMLASAAAAFFPGDGDRDAEAGYRKSLASGSPLILMDSLDDTDRERVGCDVLERFGKEAPVGTGCDPLRAALIEAAEGAVADLEESPIALWLHNRDSVMSAAFALRLAADPDLMCAAPEVARSLDEIARIQPENVSVYLSDKLAMSHDMGTADVLGDLLEGLYDAVRVGVGEGIDEILAEASDTVSAFGDADTGARDDFER